MPPADHANKGGAFTGNLRRYPSFTARGPCQRELFDTELFCAVPRKQLIRFDKPAGTVGKVISGKEIAA